MAFNVGNTGPAAHGTTATAWGGVEVVAGARRRISWGAILAGVVMAIAAQLNISREEAQNRLDQAIGQTQQMANQAVGTAKQAADRAASGLSRASLAAFVALVLGAIAAAWGGHTGARRRLPETETVEVG